MTITIPSPENQLIELENDRLKLQIEKKLLSSSTNYSPFSKHRSMREKRLHISAEQGRLKELPPEVWWLILMDAPQTAVYCPCFSEFSGWEWGELLARYPQLAEFCEDFNIFLWPQIQEIVLAQPELLCRFPAESIDWLSLLQQDAETFAPCCPDWRFSAEDMGNALESISAASGILRFQSMGRFSVEHCVAIGSAFVSRVPLYFGMGNITMERTTDSATTACSLLPVLGTFFHRRVEEPAFDSAASDIPLSES